MNTQHVIDLREKGYAIIRGFLSPDEVAEDRAATDEVYAEGMKHHGSYHDNNLLLEVLTEPGVNTTACAPASMQASADGCSW